MTDRVRSLGHFTGLSTLVLRSRPYEGLIIDMCIVCVSRSFAQVLTRVSARARCPVKINCRQNRNLQERLRIRGCFLSTILFKICNIITTSTNLHQYVYVLTLSYQSLAGYNHSTNIIAANQPLVLTNWLPLMPVMEQRRQITNNAKKPRISQGVRTNISYLRVYMCHTAEVLDTVYKLPFILIFSRFKAR